MTNDKWVPITQQVQITLMVLVVKVGQRGVDKGCQEEGIYDPKGRPL